jgi:hypothetical protein
VRYTGLTGVVLTCWPILSISLIGEVDRSDGQSKAEAAALFGRWFACIRPGGLPLVQGELACVQGGSLWFSVLVWWFPLFA